MLQGSTHYCASSGLAELKHAITNKLDIENNITAKGENILITHGAVHALYLVTQSILAEKDEVIIIAPYWMPYKSCIDMAGAKPIIIDSTENNFSLPLKEIQKSITSKTKAIIINSPNNPSGKIYPKEDLIHLAKLAEQHQIYVISDEVYEDICFTEKHHSISSLSINSDKIISLFSLSKGYAMTGWRIGYIHASESLIRAFNKLGQYTVTSICHFTQIAAITALTNHDVALAKKSMKDEYISRRNFIINRINNTWLQDNLVIPDGAFYCLINVSDLTKSSFNLTNKLLNEKHVCFTPGEAFGLEKTPFIRMTFATDITTISQSLDILISAGN